jgi:predicted nucleotidyltransferase
MSVQTPTASPDIREEVLTDPRYPVHRIADRLRPYLRVLVDQFRPEMVILFGSYAFGQPKWDSDVDLLIVKPIVVSNLRDKLAIRRAWREMPREESLLAIDLLLESPAGHEDRLARGGTFYGEIVRRGLRLV